MPSEPPALRRLYTHAVEREREPSNKKENADRNLLISLLGGKARLPPTLQTSESETISYTVAHEVQTNARNYRAAFASRTPLGALAAGMAVPAPAQKIRGDPSYAVRAQPSSMPWSIPDALESPSQWSSLVIHDPTRQSCSFISQPRGVQPKVSRALLRATVLEGIPAYHRRLSPRRPMPGAGSPRLVPIGSHPTTGAGLVTVAPPLSALR